MTGLLKASGGGIWATRLPLPHWSCASSLGSDLNCFKSNKDIKMWHFLTPCIYGAGLSSAI